MILPPGSHEEMVYNALSETFENLVFEEVVIDQIVSNELPSVENNFWWASIELFPPPIEGDVIIIVPPELMIRFTEATLGLCDAPPSDEENADNLGEVLNTLCGRLLAMRVDPGHTIKMGLPVIGRGCDMVKKKNDHKQFDCLVGDEHIYLMVPCQFFSFDSDLNGK